MSALWTSQEIAAATGTKIAGNFQANGVSIDTRSLKPGDIFVALMGETDGHRFAAQAIEKGAAASIVSKKPAENNAPEKYVLVADTTHALEDLGRYRRAQLKGKIIGLTGSVGKTSAKEMLKIILEDQGKTDATSGNLNNHFGVPLTLANFSRDLDYAVVEMGMNHAGEISKLTKIARPHVVLITTVEAVHLEFFHSVEGIAYAKAEIFEGVEPGGTAILNRDNPYYALLLKQAKNHGITKVISFGKHEDADYRLIKATRKGSLQEIEMDASGTKITYTLQGTGTHHVINSLGVLATAIAGGANLQKAAASLARFELEDGRGRAAKLTFEDKTITLIDDSYNASPASMRAAFEILGHYAGHGRTLAALGDMRELGPEAANFHAALADDLRAQGIHLVFTAGPLMRYLHDALSPGLRAVHTETAMDLLPVLLEHLRHDDILLIKGSHGSHMWKLAEALQKAALTQK